MQSNFLAQKIWSDTKYFGTCKRIRHYCPPSTVLSSWKSPPLSAFHSLTSLGIKCHTSLASNIFACTHSMHWIKLNCNYFLAWVCESSKSVFSSTAWTFSIRCFFPNEICKVMTVFYTLPRFSWPFILFPFPSPWSAASMSFRLWNEYIILWF